MATLIVPQVEVIWDGTNLSAYSLPNATQPEPLVFNVEVTCGSDNQWPTAKMNWNPTGPAFEVYEKLIKALKKDSVITIRYGYMAYGGPAISFGFNYSGTEISYGVDMSITVSLACTAAATSAASRNSMSVNKAEKFKDKGIDAKQMSEQITGGYTGAREIVWSDCALKDAKDVKIKQAQFKDQTYGSVQNNMQKELGNKIFLSNIGSDGQAIAFAPLSWQGQQKCGSIKEPVKGGKEPDPKERYGYIIGPGIITSFTRKMEYAPPTQDKLDTSGNPKNPANSSKQKPAPGSQTRPLTEVQKDAQKPNSKSVQNPSSPSNVKGVTYSENPNGPQKQKVLNEEEGVKMDAQIFMCPAITGIKPQDVIYVPSLSGKTIEDYKITSVTYSQDGGTFSVSVQGCRPYGLDTAMYPDEAKKFLEKAKSLQTLDDWANFAWRDRLSLPSV
jgi:hypothetical protein